jgi:hypothetical protein
MPLTFDSTKKDAVADRITWLDGGDVRIFRDGSGQVRASVRGARSVLRPTVVRAFPISAPDRYLELREEGGGAVGMLRQLSELDEGSRALAEELLRERYLIPCITAVHALRQEYGTWVWSVDTDRGERTFTVRNPRESIRTIALPAGGPQRMRITDVDGNVLEIPDRAALDGKSRSLLDQVG